MMLVDADTVETEVLGEGECVYVFAIEIAASFRIEEAVRTPDPGRIVALTEIVGELRPGHQVKEEELHAR